MTARKNKRKPVVGVRVCAACGECSVTCPKLAITVSCGLYAKVDYNRCAGCGVCAAVCPASVITMEVA